MTILVTATNYSKYCGTGKKILESAGCQIIENDKGRPYRPEELKKLVSDIDGAVEGDLDVKEKVAVGSTAVIKGDLIAGELAVDFGALCDVNLEKGYNQGKAAAFFDNYLKENPQ